MIPLIDYHCHINPRKIYEDRKFDNITEVWLGGDHYKWRQIRTCGIDEKYITGDASDKEKFLKWAETMPKLIGNVKLICTTDDPVDDLKWHKLIKEDDSFTAYVLPAWRPDKAVDIEKSDYTEYINKLSKAAGTKIEDFGSLKDALVKRMDYFEEIGCKVSDHGLS